MVIFHSYAAASLPEGKYVWLGSPHPLSLQNHGKLCVSCFWSRIFGSFAISRREKRIVSPLLYSRIGAVFSPNRIPMYAQTELVGIFSPSSLTDQYCNINELNQSSHMSLLSSSTMCTSSSLHCVRRGTQPSTQSLLTAELAHLLDIKHQQTIPNESNMGITSPNIRGPPKHKHGKRSVKREVTYSILFSLTPPCGRHLPWAGVTLIIW